MIMTWGNMLLVARCFQVLNQTGNQDLCYYNFLCAHPLGLLSDFNHVYSNISYILLGLLFIFLTYRRDVMHRLCDDRLDKVQTSVLLHYMPRNTNYACLVFVLFAYLKSYIWFLPHDCSFMCTFFNSVVIICLPVFYKHFSLFMHNLSFNEV